MILRIADFQALLLAGMVFGLLSTANAQSTGGAQRVVFSSPDGQISSNAPIPMIRAPEGRETPNLPAGQVAVHDFTEPMVAPMYPLPLPMLQPQNSQSGRDSLDSRDIRKKMGELTPSQIMNVPTREQIFGLPEKLVGSQKEPWQLDNENSATNNPGFDTTSLISEPSWAKLWAQGSGKSQESSNTTTSASGFFSRIFENGQNENDNGFGRHDDSSDDTFSGPAQSAPQQSSWDSAFAASGLMPSAASTAPNNFAPPAASSVELTSQSSRSPFAAPQVSTLGTMPKLPSLPSLPGQNSLLPQPPSAPSWGPKPPPWTQSQTPFGTPVPINPALKR